MRHSRIPGWWVIVPVKGTSLAKSRLAVEWHGDIRALARAFALDVIVAARSAATVAGVIVVTSAEEAASVAREVSAGDVSVRFVADPGGGLEAAVQAGVAAARDREQVPVAALLGDLPGLRAADLERALARAHEAPSSFLPDADGTGTTLVSAGRGIPFRSSFGRGSAARHRAMGLEEIDLEAEGIRRDVDTLADLLAVQRMGGYTTAVLGPNWPQRGPGARGSSRGSEG